MISCNFLSHITLFRTTRRLAPTCEWDTAAADVIVREAGGVVLQAGKCDGKGKALEDWKVHLVLVLLLLVLLL